MKTDQQLQQDVSQELRWEPVVQAAQIGVQVQDGVVTLDGQVGSYAEKWHAELAAQRVHGVKAVAVEIDVRLPAGGQRTDADIARAAKNLLEWTSYLPVDAVTVVVEGGWVTLTGAVDWQYQKLAAADGVRRLMGVTGVSDQIVVHPQLSMAAVQADIEAALKRRAAYDAQNISVRLDGSEVTLGGTVHNASERELALHAAWSTPGVSRVSDKMTLDY